MLALIALSCDDDYPLEPTFCDDWCRVTLRAGCDEEPENCVRDCELTRASDSCFSRQRRLLECYRGSSREDFVCAGAGFDQETRVDPAVCRTERDALYECEAPGIGACLAICRDTQAGQLETAYDSATGLVDFEKLSSDAGTDDACPAIDQPCESLCFSVLGFSSDALAVALDDPNVTMGDAGFDPDRTRRCVEESLLACIFGASAITEGPANGAASDGRATPDDEESRPATISDVFARCSGL